MTNLQALVLTEADYEGTSAFDALPAGSTDLIDWTRFGCPDCLDGYCETHDEDDR